MELPKDSDVSSQDPGKGSGSWAPVQNFPRARLQMKLCARPAGRAWLTEWNLQHYCGAKGIKTEVQDSWERRGPRKRAKVPGGSPSRPQHGR